MEGEVASIFERPGDCYTAIRVQLDDEQKPETVSGCGNVEMSGRTNVSASPNMKLTKRGPNLSNPETNCRRYLRFFFHVLVEVLAGCKDKPYIRLYRVTSKTLELLILEDPAR